MENKERAAEIRAEIERLKNELKAVTACHALDLKNRHGLKYPFLLGGREHSQIRVMEGTLEINGLSSAARLLLAPTFQVQKSGNYMTIAKKVKELSDEEYRAVCECVDEMVEVLNKHKERLHPNGIAIGNYAEGQSLYL